MLSRRADRADAGGADASLERQVRCSLGAAPLYVPAGDTGFWQGSVREPDERFRESFDPRERFQR
jgi:hypothetical protein